MAIPVFSNKPKFCTQQLSLASILDLPHFNALTQSSMENPGLNAFATACGDPNLATTFRKNVIHEVIRCGGKMIDLNFMMDIFGSQERMVDTKQFYNHYICDTNMNIYSGATYTAPAAGQPVVWQVLKSNHGSSGTQSLPAQGFSIWDKDNMIEYIVNSVDTTTPYAHKVTMTPTDITVQARITQNTPYLVVPARRVGGYTCQQLTNTMSTIGYSQQLAFLRVRRDWQVTIDLLRGYQDKIQYAVIYDLQGNPMDSWDVAEAQFAREGVRMALNMAAWIGTPTTNTTLIQNTGAVADPYHLGFYGLLPSIKFGNGVVYDFRSSVGFDFESDGEPIFLWQDSQKRTSRFLVLRGLGFAFANNNRSNKMVARSGPNNLSWEGYKRVGAMSIDTNETEVAKLGIKAYSYEGFGLDFKTISALSDVRYAGSDYYSNLAVMIPQDGPMENGRQINPIEFYQEGQGNWTGGYEEHYVDNRDQSNACESIQGYVAQSMSMAVHCPDLMVLLNPVVDA
jgi:hypothetical protein